MPGDSRISDPKAFIPGSKKTESENISKRLEKSRDIQMRGFGVTRRRNVSDFGLTKMFMDKRSLRRKKISRILTKLLSGLCKGINKKRKNSKSNFKRLSK